MKLMSILLIVFMATTSVAGECGHVVPLDVRARFTDSNCAEIHDFYADRHVDGQPYVYGVASLLSGSKEVTDYSFIAICRSIDGNGYSIISNPPNLDWPGGCAFPVREIDFFGSLEIKNSENKGAAKKAGDAIMYSGAFISVERDGLISEYSCNSGKWKAVSID